jgi:hypothetical protein
MVMPEDWWVVIVVIYPTAMLWVTYWEITILEGWLEIIRERYSTVIL